MWIAESDIAIELAEYCALLLERLFEQLDEDLRGG